MENTTSIYGSGVEPAWSCVAFPIQKIGNHNLGHNFETPKLGAIKWRVALKATMF